MLLLLILLLMLLLLMLCSIYSVIFTTRADFDFPLPRRRETVGDFVTGVCESVAG